MLSLLGGIPELIIKKVYDEITTEKERKEKKKNKKSASKVGDKRKTILPPTSTGPFMIKNVVEDVYVGKDRSQIFGGFKVKPVEGSLLAVGLAGGVLDHTGIYIGDGYVIEQHGDDELRKVTLKEFQNGDNAIHTRGLNISIQIACDELGKPLASKKVAKKALKMYDDYTRRNKEYSILFNNCHQFCWHCIGGDTNESLTLFSTLERKVAKHYGYILYWDEIIDDV